MSIHKLFLILTMFMTSLSSGAAAADTVLLPAPDKTGGLPLLRAVDLRHSTRTFNPSLPVDRASLSTILWAAVGYNRPQEEKRTNPTALNKQEIDVYVFDSEGVWFYDASSNSLIRKAEGDHRGLVAGTKNFSQDFVLDAPVSLVITADISLFEGIDADKALMMGCCDAGIVSENINLCCSALGLATVPRATMDSEGIARLLGLGKTKVPVLNNPVGHAL